LQKAHNNQELFSNYYLEERMPDREAWQNPEGLEEVYEEISELYEERKDILESTKEAQTEEEWIKPILHTLGFKYIPQPSQEIFDTTKEPDYAFFLNDEEKDRAYQAAKEDKKRLFDFALAVGDAKRWNLNLNNLRPNKQIDEYLRITDSKWGLLTNGRQWRLYHRDSSYRLDIYYEVDIVDLIEAGDKEKFKYFYLFFRAHSFVEDGFLTEVYERSEDYTASVSEDLKENAFDALQELCQGFLSGNPDLGEEDLDDIYENSLVLLYRLIFLLYAESDEEENLLPMDNKEYRTKYSLKALKQDAVKDTIDGDSLHSSFSLYWAHLKGLFSVIDNGEDTLGVYAYNGGLFDKERHPFIDEEHSIGDKYLAEAIRKVSYSEAEGGFIDYQDLDVRELGAIYEGLLEHKPVIDGEQVKWEEDLSERKKTGSYYTPEYIVKYIVENTIGPLVEEKKEELQEEIEELKQRKKGSRGYDREVYERKLKEKRAEVREEILDLKVLDPAMGSGHFLVEATEKLANEIAALEEEFSPDEDGDETPVAETEQEDPVKELKRQIVERSIYGVDKNPLATELAKLSLWLHTVAKNEPLSFLDHHLRTGDSLIGIGVEEMKTMPSEREQMAGLFTSNLVKDLGNAIGHLNLIEEITSGSREDVQEKKAEWRDVRNWIDKYKKAANVRLSTAFDNEVNDDEYREVLQAAANDNLGSVENRDFFQKAQEIAKDHSFFHWELAFPDVFRNETGKARNEKGFNALIGNPPYIKTHNLPKYYRSFLNTKYDIASQTKQPDIYQVFVEKSEVLTSKNNFSLIVPSLFYNGVQYSFFRKKLMDYGISKIVDCGDEVFEDVGMPTGIIKFIKGSKEFEVYKLYSSDINSLSYQKTTDYQFVEQNPSYQFAPYSDSNSEKILAKLNQTETRVRDKFDWLRGLELGKTSELLSEKKTSTHDEKILLGENVEQYAVKSNKWINASEANLKKGKFFFSEKLLIRETGKKLTSLAEKKGLLTARSLYNFIKSGFKATFEVAVAQINSSLLQFYYANLFRTKTNLFPKIRINQATKLPVLETEGDLSSLVEKISNLKRKKFAINLNLKDYLKNYPEGRKLKDVYTPVKDVAKSIATKTIEEYQGLNIGKLEIEERGSDLIILISARYKPEDPDKLSTLDQWGYHETETFPVMHISSGEKMKDLIKEFVTLAKQKAGGFANFRKNATKTISLLDRLEDLTLPKLEDVKSGLEKYLEQKEKAEKLEREIKETDHQIDAVVFDLYELEEDEVKTVLDSLETPEDEKSDILRKFKGIK